MGKKNIILRILFLLIILSLTGYFIYKDYSSAKDSSLKNLIPGNVATTTPLFDAGAKKDDVKVVSIEPEKTVLQGTIPDLNKKWVIPESFSGEAKRIIEDRVAVLNKELSNNNDQYDKWIDLGGTRKLVADYVEAKNIWEFAALNWPDSIVAYHNLGDLYGYYLKDATRAQMNMQKVIDLDPHYVSEYLALYSFNKQADVLLKGLTNNPESVDLMMAIARSYKDNADMVNARKYYEMALAQAKVLKNVALQNVIENEIALLRS